MTFVGLTLGFIFVRFLTHEKQKQAQVKEREVEFGSQFEGIQSIASWLQGRKVMVEQSCLVHGGQGGSRGIVPKRKKGRDYI